MYLLHAPCKYLRRRARAMMGQADITAAVIVGAASVTASGSSLISSLLSGISCLERNLRHVKFVCVSPAPVMSVLAHWLRLLFHEILASGRGHRCLSMSRMRVRGWSEGDFAAEWVLVWRGCLPLRGRRKLRQWLGRDVWRLNIRLAGLRWHHSRHHPRHLQRV